jgi:signal transduction histidine kinase
VPAQLEVIANAGERMQDLVTSMQAQTGRTSPEPFEEVDLREVVEASVASFAPLIAAGRQELELDGAPALVITGDAFRLRQVLDNLIGNAVKYTPTGGRIGVRLDAVGGQVELTVTDTGIGIAADDLPRLFEPYFRTDSAVRGGISGTGLGMGIARDIVVAHDGAILVDSEVGLGTTVTVRFPRRRTEEVPT